MAWSSAAVSASRPISPRLNRPRKSKRLFGRNRLPICSARNGGLVRDSKVSSAMLVARCNRVCDLDHKSPGSSSLPCVSLLWGPEECHATAPDELRSRGDCCTPAPDRAAERVVQVLSTLTGVLTAFQYRARRRFLLAVPAGPEPAACGMVNRCLRP